MGLYQKYRPTKLEEVVGQPAAVKTISTLLKKGTYPHATLFSGPSGVGKTTLARIVARKLRCLDSDFVEVNCAVVSKPIDTIRSIKEVMGLSSMAGNGHPRIWLLDEVQSLSRAGFAQQALLKMLEEPPKHVYFMLASTDVNKIIPTIRTRCTQVNLSSIPDQQLDILIQGVCAAEKVEDVTEVIRDKIVELSEGSARKSLVLLEQVIDIAGEDERLECLVKSDEQVVAVEICRALFRRASWAEVAKVVKQVDEDPEMVRRRILVYATAVLLSGGKQSARAALVVETFRDHFFDCGRAGLAAGCYAVCLDKT